MTMTMKCAIRIFALGAVFSTPTLDAQHYAAHYGHLQRYFAKSSFLGEGFQPTPYGADRRFSPKSVWIQIDSAAPAGRWIRRSRRAWIPFSTGAVLYEGIPIHRSPVSLPQIGGESSRELAISWLVALSPTPDRMPESFDSNIAFSRITEASIDFPEAEIEFVYYFDLVLAQSTREFIVRRVNEALQNRFNRIPPRRVITAAIRVRNPIITVTSESGVTLGSEAELEAWGKLGLRYSRESDTLSALAFDDWRYIAFQALSMDDAWNVNTTRETTSWNEFLLQSEWQPWEAFADMGSTP